MSGGFDVSTSCCSDLFSNASFTLKGSKMSADMFSPFPQSSMLPEVEGHTLSEIGNGEIAFSLQDRWLESVCLDQIGQ